MKAKKEFSKNVLILLTGTSLGQIIPILFSPILTRIYFPEDFGVMSLFLSFSAIFGNIINGKYELAIMHPKKDEDALLICVLGFIINLVGNLFLMLIIIIFHNYIIIVLNNKKIYPWLYLIPINVFLVGFYYLLNFYHNRKKNYKILAKANVLKAFTLTITQLIIGILTKGASGLIIGQIISQLFMNIKLFFDLKLQNLNFKINKKKIVALAKRYKNFPKYTLLAALINVLYQSLLPIYIAKIFSLKIVGFFSLAQRMLGMPAIIIGNAISQIFFHEAIKERREKKTIKNSFKYSLKKLIFIGVVVFGSLFFIVEDIFQLVFGDKWYLSGVYAKILIPFYFFRFVSSSLAITTTIFEKQKITLLINAVLLLTLFLSFFIKKIFFLNFSEYLLCYVFLMSVNYVIFLIYYFKLSCN